MSEVKQIISKLPGLTKAERGRIRQTIEFLDGGKGKSAVTKGASDDWLTPGILYELKRRGMSYIGISEQRLNSLAPNYATDSAAVRADMRERLKRAKAQNSDVRLDQAELISFGRVVARALAEYLQPVAPVGLKLLLGNISKVPDAIEASFPDYLSCSMLGLLIGRAEVRSQIGNSGER